MLHTFPDQHNPCSVSAVHLAPRLLICPIFFFLKNGYLFCGSSCTNTHETLKYNTPPIYPHLVGFWSTAGLLSVLVWPWAWLRFFFFLSLRYIINSACVFEVGRLSFYGQRALSPSSYLTHACYTLQHEGHEARLQILDSAHLQRVTNYDERNILSGSAGVQ